MGLINSLFGLVFGRLLGKYCQRFEQLLAGLLMPLVFARIIPDSVSLCYPLLLLPAFLLGMLTAVFFHQAKESKVQRAVLLIGVNIVLGLLFSSGYLPLPPVICFAIEGAFMTGGLAALLVVLCGVVAIFLPTVSAMTAGVLTIILSALAMQSALLRISQIHTLPFCLGIVAGLILLFI